MKLSFRYILAGAALAVSAAPLVASAQGTAGARPARPTTSAAAPEGSAIRGGSPAIQQTAGTAAASGMPHKIGLVDVGYIFSNYEKLEDQRNALAKEIEASDVELKGIQQEIQGIQEQIKSVKDGSEARIQMEQKLTELNAQGQAKMSNLRREFVRKEVAMYKEIYDEVSSLVAAYANAKGQNYTLILRYQRDAGATEAGDDPNKIMARVNQLVVYHQKADDITDKILEYMNGQYIAQKGAGASAAAPAPTRRN